MALIPGVGAPRNPFSTQYVCLERFHTDLRAGTSVAQIWSRARSLGPCVQIVGGHGTGKSTLLHALESHARDVGHATVLVRVGTDARHVPAWKVPTRREALQGERCVPWYLFLDSAERLTTWQWLRTRWQCRIHGGGMVVTTHASRGVPVLCDPRVDGDLAESLVREVLGRAGDVVRLVHAREVRAVLQQEQGDMRRAFRALYHLYERRWKDENTAMPGSAVPHAGD